MNNLIFKNLFLALAILCSVINLQGNEDIKNLSIIHTFPTEPQMEQSDFVIHMAHRMSITNNRLYICDQMGHTIFISDLDGNYVGKIGRHGEGPGEFHLPLTVFSTKDRVFVGDNGNSRIQVFSLEGEYKRNIPLLQSLHEFVVCDGNFFILMFGSSGTATRSSPVFGIFNMQGELQKTINESFHSEFNNFADDNTVRMRLIDGFIHCLQVYGTTYRIYDKKGNKVKEFELEINPLEDSEYKKIKYKGTYLTFDVYNNIIFANHALKGKIVIYAFDMDGRLLHKYAAILNPENIYRPGDMRIIKKDNETRAYLLMCLPNTQIIVAKLQGV